MEYKNERKSGDKIGIGKCQQTPSIFYIITHKWTDHTHICL